MSYRVDNTEDSRSVYFAKDIHQMNLVLGKFLQKSGADTVLLVDEAGHLVARQGETSPASEDTITALVAGSFAASQAMAVMLGDAEFTSLIPCGEERNLMIVRAGDRALLSVAFREHTSVPLLRTYALDAIRRLMAIFDGPHPGLGSSDEQIERTRFDSEIDGALSDVFG